MGSVKSNNIEFIPTPEGYVPPDEKFLGKLDDLLFEFFGVKYYPFGLGTETDPHPHSYSYDVKVDDDGTAHINLEIYKVKYFKNSETNNDN